MGQVTRADIDNEAQVISSFMENGGHRNIITITAHGWMQEPAFNYYFIDMELCEMNLCQYIAQWGGSTTPNFELVPAISPVFVGRTCWPVLRMRNIWTIGTHIARGLEFLHSNGQVHRDLKPQNGMTTIIVSVN